MSTFGGECRFTYNGNTLVMRAHVKIMPTRRTFTTITNQDGSIASSAKPNAAGFEITFQDDTSYDWDAIMAGAPYDITISEDFTGVIHMFTGARLSGDVTIDRETGEVTGIKGNGAYQKVTA